MDFEEAYLALLERQRLCQWENYASSARHDLSRHDGELLALLEKARHTVGYGGRKQRILESLLYRGLVDLSPTVSALRNRLDDWDNYASPDSRGDALAYRLNVAEAMRSDVLALMAERTRRAQHIGFQSYPALVFFSEELQQQTVESQVQELIQASLPEARRLVVERDMSWETWFSQLGDSTGDIDTVDPRVILGSFLDRLGYGGLLDSMTLVYEHQPIAGLVVPVSIPGDIRMLLSPINTLSGLATLFHECGHAVAHALCKEEGLYTTCTSCFGETIACLFEHVGTVMCSTPEQQTSLATVSLLEQVRLAISFQFEMDLWRTAEGADERFCEHYARLGPVPRYGCLWACDSFRSVDPVYVHNYVLGRMWAERVVSRLRTSFGDDYPAWGAWIWRAFLVDGGQRSLVEKLDTVGCL